MDTGPDCESWIQIRHWPWPWPWVVLRWQPVCPEQSWGLSVESSLKTPFHPRFPVFCRSSWPYLQAQSWPSIHILPLPGVAIA